MPSINPHACETCKSNYGGDVYKWQSEGHGRPIILEPGAPLGRRLVRRIIEEYEEA
jgi:hypothetical protein